MKSSVEFQWLVPALVALFMLYPVWNLRRRVTRLQQKLRCLNEEKEAAVITEQRLAEAKITLVQKTAAAAADAQVKEVSRAKDGEIARLKQEFERQHREWVAAYEKATHQLRSDTNRTIEQLQVDLGTARANTAAVTQQLLDEKQNAILNERAEVKRTRQEAEQRLVEAAANVIQIRHLDVNQTIAKWFRTEQLRGRLIVILQGEKVLYWFFEGSDEIKQEFSKELKALLEAAVSAKTGGATKALRLVS